MWENDALLQAHLSVPDPEFSAVLATGRFEHAVVEAHEIASSRYMLRR